MTADTTRDPGPVALAAGFVDRSAFVVSQQEPSEPPLFIRAHLIGATGSHWYDVAIDDISAVGVPIHQGDPVPLIVGGLNAKVAWDSYWILHNAWVARRRAAAASGR